MISSVRFGAQPSLTPEEFSELQWRIQNTHGDIKLQILKHLSADQWESSIDNVLADKNPPREVLDQLHLITAYRDTDILKKTAQRSPVLVEAIRKNRPILFNWFLKLPRFDQKWQELLNQTNPAGVSPLHEAIMNDRFQTAKQLINLGAKVTLEDAYLAAYHGKRAFLESTLLPALGLSNIEDMMDEAEQDKVQQQRETLIELAKNQQINIQNLQRLPQQQKDGSLHFRISRNGHDAASIISLIRAGANVHIVDANNGKGLLHLAAETRQNEVLDALLSHGAPVDTQDNKGDSVLHYAIKNKQVDLVKKLLKYQPNLDALQTNYPQNTFLNVALESGGQEITRLIIEHNPALITQKNQYEKLPLKEVIGSGNIETFKLMLEIEPSIVNYQDYYGDGPYQWAASAGQKEIVEALLHEKKDSVQRLDRLHNTLLHLAAHRGHTELVKLLIGMDESHITKPNQYHRTPLHEAASSNNLDTVKAILAHHPRDTKQFTSDGYTPLHYALQSNPTDDIALALLNHDPSLIDVCTKNQQNLLHLLPAYPKHAGLAEKLIEKAPHLLEAQDADGQTPLHHAVSAMHLPSVQRYLETNRKMAKIANHKDDLPIHIAIQKSNNAALQLLLSKSPQTANAGNRLDETPLYLAVKYHKNQALPILINAGADINIAESQQSRTPLHIAVINKDFSLVKSLLAYHPNPYRTDKNGQTALDIANDFKQETDNKLKRLATSMRYSRSDFKNYTLGLYDPEEGHRYELNRTEADLKAITDLVQDLEAYQSKYQSRKSTPDFTMGKRIKSHLNLSALLPQKFD